MVFPATTSRNAQVRRRNTEVLNASMRLPSPARREEAEAAVRYARKANFVCGGRNAAVLDTLARALAASGKRDEALTTARRAAELAPDDEEIAGFAAELESNK